MNIWELLGIAPTEDISTIKSAYARQAKQYHPEEHPEEFKALQNAYKMAVKLAKNKAVGAYYVRSAPGEETQAAAARERAQEQMQEQEAEAEQVQRQEAEAEQAQMQEQEAEAEQMQGQEAEAGAEHVQERETEAERAEEQEEEHTFDFSDVDAYGDRERFFKQFLLLARNPYLINNVEAWDCFLNRRAFAELFSNTNFRMELVETMRSVWGWRRKTVLYFERFLSAFHTEENRPEDGVWETQTAAFRRVKLSGLRMPAFFTDRFWQKEGINFHKQLMARAGRMAGRNLDLNIEPDLIRYIALYLSVGEKNESYIERLYNGWRFEDIAFSCAAAAIVFCVILSGLGVSSGKSKEVQAEYITELYRLDERNSSEEEREEAVSDYRTYWEYGQDAIDDARERYREWNEQ